MARQNIGVGTVANDGTGDPLRTGIIKVNENFTELYTDAPISNTVTVGNSTINTFINATAVYIGNSSVNTQINTTSISTRNLTLTGDLTVTGNVSFEGETLFSNAINITTTDKMFILANGAANAAAANSSGIAINTFANLVYIAAASGWQSNVNFVPSENNLTLGNTTSVWNLYANTINAVSVSLTGSVNVGTTISTGNATIIGFANIGTTLTAGNTTITGYINAISSVNAVSYTIGSTLVANTTGLYHTGIVNAAVIEVGSSFIANTTAVTIASGVGLSANGNFGTGGQVLTTNGTSVYWSTVSSNGGGGSVNVDAQYTWTNLHVHTSNVLVSGAYNNVEISPSYLNIKQGGGASSFGNLQITSYSLEIDAKDNSFTDGTVPHITVSNTNGNYVYKSYISHKTIKSQFYESGNSSSNSSVEIDRYGIYFTRTGIYANNTYGDSGQVLTSNGSSVYWANTSSGTSIALNSNTTSTNTFYLPLANTTSGTWSNGVVSSSLYFVPSTGTLSATVFNSLSDREKKENIRTITDAIEIINQLNGVRFDWKNNGVPSAGLIAQDVEKQMPELVYTDPITNDKSLNYSGVIAVLVEAVKYLINKG